MVPQVVLCVKATGGRVTGCIPPGGWSRIRAVSTPEFPSCGRWCPLAEEEKIYIIGMGENGLDGLTAAARRLIEGAELLIGEEHTLRMVPETERPATGNRHQFRRGGRADRRVGGQTDRGSGHGRSALLRRGPIPVRQARKTAVRGPAARQQHATGLCPGQRELGRGVPHQPGHPQPAERAGADPRGGEGGAVHQRDMLPRQRWPGPCWTWGSITSPPMSART